MLLVLLVYATLAYFVFFCYGPRIVEEESRQEGLSLAIAEVKEEYRMARNAWAKKKANLEKTVRDEKMRRSLLEKRFRGHPFGSDYEWQCRTDERIAQAQEALILFQKSSKEAVRLMEAGRQLSALRVRQQELQDLCEMRDRLMVWPLPLIAPLFDDKKEQ